MNPMTSQAGMKGLERKSVKEDGRVIDLLSFALSFCLFCASSKPTAAAVTIQTSVQQNSNLGSAQKTDMFTSAPRPQRRHGWTESNFKIRSNFTAAVPGLIVGDVNFKFSRFVRNHRFCFLQVLCPTVFVLLGHHVLLKNLVSMTLCPIRWSKKCAILVKCQTSVKQSTAYKVVMMMYMLWVQSMVNCKECYA